MLRIKGSKDMVGKVWKRICALIIASVLFMGMLPGECWTVSAKESADTKVQVFHNPLYEEEIAEADDFLIAEQLLSSGAETLNEPAWMATAEEAMAYIKEQMVLRKTEIVFKIERSALAGGIDTRQLFYGAMEHTEECSGQEGDALNFGWRSVGTYTSSNIKYYQIT